MYFRSNVGSGVILANGVIAGSRSLPNGSSNGNIILPCCVLIVIPSTKSNIPSGCASPCEFNRSRFSNVRNGVLSFGPSGIYLTSPPPGFWYNTFNVKLSFDTPNPPSAYMFFIIRFHTGSEGRAAVPFSNLRNNPFDPVVSDGGRSSANSPTWYTFPL